MTEAEMEELRALVSWDAAKRTAGCLGKVKFPTYDTAQLGNRHKGNEPYRCRTCQQFHVGTPDRKKVAVLKDKRTRLRIKSRERDEEKAA